MTEFTPQIQAHLAAYFPIETVQWKAQATTKDKTRAMAVAYIDARDVMDRLDAAAGVAGWSDTYRVVTVGDETAVECTLTVLGISKTDVGTIGDSGDAAKGAYSDALKRAAVKFGVGRYLYSIPKQWVDYDDQKKQFKGTPVLPKWAIPTGESKPQATVVTTPAPQPAPQTAKPARQTVSSLRPAAPTQAPAPVNAKPRLSVSQINDQLFG